MTVGPAGYYLGPGEFVSSGLVYSSQMRLYQTEPVPSSAPALLEAYNYSDGSYYAWLYVYWNSGTPVYMSVAGGNKYARCYNTSQNHSAQRTMTCQRYSTT